MATLSSIPTKIPPVSPWHFECIENLNSEQKLTLWSLQEGFAQASSAPFPIRVIAPLPCKSSAQSKDGLARRSKGSGKGKSLETIVGSCISRAVAFSNSQFKAILKSFSDSCARKNTSLGDVRCHSAGKTYSNGPVNNNGNGDGDDGGGSRGGSGSSSSGGGGKHALAANWWRCQNCSTRGKSAFVMVANQPQTYHHAASATNAASWQWVVEWMAHAAVTSAMTRAMNEPAIVDFILQAAAFPFLILGFLVLGPEFGDSLQQFFLAVLGTGFTATTVLVWLLWGWWKSRGQGVDADGEGDKGEDEDTA